ncbi:MAG: response regulator [Symbiopectobacterium sp.]|uniref:response regulator n=1 Tax=Symbiopectobacterium sp. TaxID=2952789 RepID=UPI0039EB3466
MRLLIVEDDALLQEGLLLALSQEGYACDCAGGAKQADALLNSAQYSLVVLDLGLPDGDGLQLLARWRKHHQHIPVLILTARDTIDDRVSGLDSGADDYLVKPFALTELLLRNLIENAHRYNPPASIITVRLTANPQITLQIRDQGPGIDESKVGELSKAFVRMDTRYGGIGLELSIVTRVAQLHHGTLQLSNLRDGSGALAEVTFPPLLS